MPLKSGRKAPPTFQNRNIQSGFEDTPKVTSGPGRASRFSRAGGAPGRTSLQFAEKNTSAEWSLAPRPETFSFVRHMSAPERNHSSQRALGSFIFLSRWLQ